MGPLEPGNDPDVILWRVASDPGVCMGAMGLLEPGNDPDVILWRVASDPGVCMGAMGLLEPGNDPDVILWPGEWTYLQEWSWYPAIVAWNSAILWRVASDPDEYQVQWIEGSRAMILMWSCDQVNEPTCRNDPDILQ